MEILGIVQNGVVVLPPGMPLPEGARVRVIVHATVDEPAPAKKTRIVFPLVRSKQPMAVTLTNEMIAEIFDEEDTAPRR